MAINGQLTGAGLGRLLVSGLKAGKPGAASHRSKSNVDAPRQAEDGGHPARETQALDAAEAGSGAPAVNGTLRSISPVPGDPFDGQPLREAQNTSAIEDGTGAHPAAETQEEYSPGADSSNVADQKPFAIQTASVGGSGDGTIALVKPIAPPSRHPISADQSDVETRTTSVGGCDERAQRKSEIQSAASPLIAQLIQAARLRRRWHKAEKSLILQGRALCRAWTGGDKIAANGVFDRAAAGEANDPVILVALSPFLAAIGKFASERAAIEKDLRKLARQLPVWKGFAEGVKGLGELRLALVVGECGDIGSYRNPSCVWKRMGLAVIDGDRQRRKTDPDEALRNGYNAERRAMAYVLGTELIKAQLRAPKDEDGKRTDGDTMAIGAYGQIYLDRRAYETAREIPKAHAHNRAARYMTKRLFRDLYAAWRKT